MSDPQFHLHFGSLIARPRTGFAWIFLFFMFFVGFHLNFEVLKKDALAQSSPIVRGSGTPGFLAKWISSVSLPPELSNLAASGGGISVPPWSGSNPGTPAPGENPAGACSLPLRPLLSWTYSDPDGNPQSAYQVQVDNNSDFSSPETDTGKTNSSTDSIIVSAGALVYNTQYYWRVQAWDSNDLSSGWIEGPSFSTQLHQAPLVDYTWNPNSPSKNERVEFTDKTSAFGNATVASWNWTFEDGVPADSDQQNPRTRFTSQGLKTTSLTVQDSDSLSCRAQKILGVEWPTPPEFRETTPN